MPPSLVYHSSSFLILFHPTVTRYHSLHPPLLSSAYTKSTLPTPSLVFFRFCFRWCYWGEFSDCTDKEIWKTLCRERYCLEHTLTKALTQLSQECVKMDCVGDSCVARVLPAEMNESLVRLILSQDMEQNHE